MDFRLLTIDFRGLLIPDIVVSENDQILYTVISKGLLNKTYEFQVDRQVVMRIEVPNFLSAKSIQIFRGNEKLSQFDPPFFGNDISIESIFGNYFIESKGFFKKSFTISNSTQEIAKISRKKGMLSDQFGIAIHANEHIDIILAISIYIIIRLRKQEKSSS